MDNARIHHGEAILELTRQYGMYFILVYLVPTDITVSGVRLEFLPPYSPDLNPIEEAFSKIKAWIRRHADELSHDDGIFYDLLLALDVITADDACSYIHHSGYH